MQQLTYKEEFIRFMVENGVLRFGEFTLKSGRKAPYFINTGNYKTGAQLARLGAYYAACVHDNGLQADTLVGPAYKGIPLAVTTAVALYEKYGTDVNYCFDRKEVKDHGEGGLFVGKALENGERVIIVEDVMTSGKGFEGNSAQTQIGGGCGNSGNGHFRGQNGKRLGKRTFRRSGSV